MSGCCICKCTSASWQPASAANTGQPAPRSPATLRRARCLLLRRDYSKEFSILAASRISHPQQERSADPLLFIAHYVQQVAASSKLPLELGGNIHLFRQRWWKSTFIPALLTPPPHGGSLLLAHIKLGELLVDRGMLVAQQVCTCVYTPPCMLVTVTIAQWDDFLVRVRQLSQDHKQLPLAAPAAAALPALASSGGSRPGVPLCSLSILRSSHAQLHEMQVTRVMLRRLPLRPTLLNIRRL